jgi:hypothetical protein
MPPGCDGHLTVAGALISGTAAPVIPAYSNRYKSPSSCRRFNVGRCASKRAAAALHGFNLASPVCGRVQRLNGSGISMERQKLDGHNGSAAADHSPGPADNIDEFNEGYDDVIATAATVGVVGVGVIVFEAALLPGLVLGVATMLVPKYLPKVGAAMNPLIKSTVRGAYKMGQKTREMVAEVQEQVHDIVAEVDAEGDKKAVTPKSPVRPAPAPTP